MCMCVWCVYMFECVFTDLGVMRHEPRMNYYSYYFSIGYVATRYVLCVDVMLDAVKVIMYYVDMLDA